MKVEKSTSEKRVRLDVRMKPEDKVRTAAAASAAGKSVNAYTTEWLVSQADDVINRNEMKVKN